MASARNGLAWIAAIAMTVALVFSGVAAMAPALAFGESAQLTAAASSGDGAPFTVEDTDYGISDSNITGKRIVLASGVEAINYERYHPADHDLIENGGDGFLILREQVTDGWKFYLVNKSAEIIKEFKTAGEDEAPVLFLVSCDKRNGDGSDDGRENRDTLYSVLNPENGLYDIFNSTSGEYHELDATEIGVAMSDYIDWPSWGVTYKVGDSRGILAFDGTTLSDPEYTTVDLLGRLENGTLIYDAANDDSHYIIPSDGSWKAGPYTECGNSFDHEDDESILMPYLEVGFDDYEYGLLSLETGELLTEERYSMFTPIGKGAFLGDNQDLITSVCVTDLASMFPELEDVEAYSNELNDGLFWVKGLEAQSYYVEGEGSFDSYVNVYNLVDSRGEVVGTKKESYEPNTGNLADAVMGTVGNFAVVRSPVNSSWVGDDSPYYPDYDTRLVCLNPDASHQSEARSLNLCSDQELEERFEDYYPLDVVTLAYDPKYTFCCCADGSVSLVNVENGKVVCDDLSGERFELSGKELGGGARGAHVDIIFEGRCGEGKWGLINTITDEFSGFKFEGYIPGGCSNVAVFGRNSGEQARWFVDGMLIDESFNVIREFDYDKEAGWPDDRLSIDVGSDFACVVKDYTGLQSGSGGGDGGGDENDGSTGDLHDLVVHVIDKDGAMVNACPEFFDGIEDFGHENGLSNSFRVRDEQTGLVGLVGRDCSQIVEATCAHITAEYNFMRYAEEPDVDEEPLEDNTGYSYLRDRACGLMGCNGSWLVYGDYRVPAEWGRRENCRPFGHALVLQEASGDSGHDGDEGQAFYFYDFSEYAKAQVDGHSSSGGGSSTIGSTSNVSGSFSSTYENEPRVFKGEKGFRYKDSYFYDSATKYNHSLATMSLCMAFSAYGIKPYSSYDASVRQLMGKCGFAAGGRYKQYHFNEVPEQNFVGCAIGSKEIARNGSSVTLIAVAVRGGGYEDEWASNFDVGLTGDHAGFDLNAGRVKDYVIDYIQEHHISGYVKIWITGFSRAAAVATQAAAKLNNLAGFAYEDDQAASGSGYTQVDFDKDSIYAYGFATPAGACKESNPHSKNYSNIWNIIEYNDPVPMVAPAGWHFDRYGTTKILPYRESNDAETYGEYFSRMRNRLNMGYGYNIEGFTNYILTGNVVLVTAVPNPLNHDTQGTVLRKFVRGLTEVMGDRKTFKNEYQLTVQAVVENFLGGHTKDHNLSEFFWAILNDFVFDKVPQYMILHPHLSATLAHNRSTLVEVHQDQDYYLGWMQLMDKNYAHWLPEVWGDPCYRIFKSNCPVDLYVYNADGSVVASIVDDVPSTGDGQPIIVSIDENGQKVAYLPNGSGYRVEVKARKDCEVTCGLEEVNGERGAPVRITNFETTTLASGACMEAEIPELPEGGDGAASQGSDVSYAMSSDGGDVEVASDIRGEEAIAAHTFEVAVSYEEAKGKVYGGGSFVEGSFARLEAVGNGGYAFDGYYIDGERYENADGEDANVARFKVTKDVVVEARFSKMPIASVPSAATGLVYTGEVQEGVVAGEGCSVEGGTATNAGSYIATVTPDVGYAWGDGTSDPLEISWSIEPAAVTGVSLSTTLFTHNGKVQKPTVKSVNAGSFVLEASEYSVKYSSASPVAAGSYTVTVTGKGNYAGSKSATFKIAQAPNMAAVAKASVKKSFKAKALKKKAKAVALPSVFTAFGAAKWKVAKKDKKKVLSLKGGKVKVKKGAKRGKYTIKLKASVAETADYAAASTKVVTVKVTVK